LAKVPPFAIWTGEFDYLRRDSIALAERGQKVGKLLDISDMPGVLNCYAGSTPDSKEVKWLDEEQLLAFDIWVRGKKRMPNLQNLSYEFKEPHLKNPPGKKLRIIIDSN